MNALIDSIVTSLKPEAVATAIEKQLTVEQATQFYRGVARNWMRTQQRMAPAVYGNIGPREIEAFALYVAAALQFAQAEWEAPVEA